MNDLISRQAVFDQITASINQFGGRYSADQLNMWGMFTQMIKELPSAWPEQRWIPRSEKLPEEYGNYLITEMPIGDFEIEPYVATYYPEDDEWTTGSPIKIVRRPVIAWMPLPEPYRKDGEADG